MDVVRCAGVVWRVRRRALLDHLDLTVGAGEVVGLTGPGRAGKTLLLSLLTGLAEPAAGTITVLGRAVPHPATAAKAGTLVGRPGWAPWRTGREHLAALAAAGPPLARDAIDDALELAGLGRLAERRLRHWPAPQRHRLALAGALLGRPRLLLLDEPVAGLDPEGAAHMTRVLTTLAAEGTTMLLAARRLGRLESLCDRLVALEDGKASPAGPGGLRRLRGSGVQGATQAGGGDAASAAPPADGDGPDAAGRSPAEPGVVVLDPAAAAAGHGGQGGAARAVARR